MSLGLRNLPNKFTPFVNTRKRITKIDRRLPKHVQSSPFLKEFLNKPATVCLSLISGDESQSSKVPSLNQYCTVNYYDIQTKWPEALDKTYNQYEQQIAWIKQQKSINIQSLNTINIVNEYRNNEALLANTDAINSSNNAKPSILYTEPSPNIQDVDEKELPHDHRPTEEQLEYVYKCLSRDLPNVFVRRFDYSIYTPDIVCVNNIRGIVTTGIFGYVKQVALLRVLGHIKYAYVTLEILKITKHPEDGTVKVRWRIVGVSGTYIFLKFWKIRLWRIMEDINNIKKTWYDGFSTFYVNNEGKIYKHVVDKMMPDQDTTTTKVKTPVATVALFVPLANLDICNSISVCSKIQNELT